MLGASCSGDYTVRSGVPQLCCHSGSQAQCGWCDVNCGGSFPMDGGRRVLQVRIWGRSCPLELSIQLLN